MAQVKLLKIASDGIPLEMDSTADEITLLTGQFGNVKAAGNAITSEDTNGDLTVTPNGTGDLVLDGLNWPQADGTNGQVIQTNGSGQLSFTTISITNAETVCNEYTADEALSAAEMVYISAADNVSLCDTSGGGAPSRAIGFTAAAAADTNPVSVCSAGVLAGFTGLTAGSRYYADPSTPGGVTTTTPTGTGNTVVQAGYAKSATEMQIQIMQLGRRA